MRHVLLAALLAGAWAVTACGGTAREGADVGAPDAGTPEAGPREAGAFDAADDAPPFVLRLTTSAAPSAATPAANLTQWNWNRQLAVADDGTVHVVWAQLGTLDVNLPADRPDPVDVATLPPGRIFYLRSTDGGDTWSAETPLTERAAGVDSASVATSGADVYVVWRAGDAGRLRVFSRRSSDGGLTWGAPVAVSDNPVGVSVSPPAVATSAAGPGAEVYVVWADGRTQTVGGQPKSVKEVYLARGDDRGATWGPAVPVSVPDGFSSWTPAVAVWEQTVHVAWTDERDDVGECTSGTNSCREEEYYRRSRDGGETWEPETRLTFDPAGAPRESWAPSVAAWGGSVHVAYLDKRTGFFQVYHRRSTDAGATFGDETLLAADPAFANAARPTVAARAGEVHLTWFGFTDFDADVYYARSSDDGATWSPFVSLTADAAAVGAARVPHVGVGPDGRAHVLWYDTRLSDAAGPRIELFYGRPGG
jgi:hypothetical protein